MFSVQFVQRQLWPARNIIVRTSHNFITNFSRSYAINVRMEAARMREHAFDIFNAAYKAVLPQAMIEGALKLDGNILKIDNRRYTLDKNVHIVAFGKAVIGMVKTTEDILGEHVVGGIASVPWGIQDTFKHLGKWDQLPVARSRVRIIEGAVNNLPDERAHAAAMEIYRLLLSLTEKDIVLALISGGGSSLLPAPIAPITISELVELTKLMSRSGATIQQMNTIRKHIELLKGGGLAKAAYPAQVIGLMMSDVVGNELQFLSSGPTVPDFTTPQQCLDLLDSMDLMDHTPASIISVLEEKAQLPEFTKDIIGYGENVDLEQVVEKNQPSFHCNNVQNLIIGSNIIALNAGHRFAQLAGYDSYLLPQPIVGDATERGETFALLANYICRSVARGRSADPALVQAELDIVRLGIDRRVVIDLRRLLEASGNTGRPICVLAAGETTVRVSGKGRGGRNQHMALSCAIHMDKIMSDLRSEFAVEFLSSGTDGQDGPTDAAGAVVDPDTVRRALKSGMDPHSYLTNNDSYGFFSKLDKGRNQIRTGLTGTNVMDLQVVLISRCIP